MKLIYEQLNSGMLDEAVKCLSYGFANYETMCKYLKVKGLELEKIFKQIVQGCYSYSYVAKDPTTNRIIGVAIYNDLNFFIKIEPPNILCSKLQAIMALLSELEGMFIDKNSDLIKERKYIYGYAMYVEPEYNGKGASVNLAMIAEENAKKQGFDNLVYICTGKISQGLAIEVFNLKVREKIEYKNFKFNGDYVFSNIEDVSSCMLLTRAL